MNNTKEDDWLNYLKLILTVISMTGCIFVCLLFIFVKRIRSFPMEMVVYLCMACLFVNISYSIYTVGETVDDNLCKSQTFLMIWSETSMYLWAAIIGFWLYQRVVHMEEGNNEKASCLQRMKFLSIGYIFPVIISTIGYFLDIYGPSGDWCWVKKDTNKANIFAILLYVFDWLLIFINFFYNYLVIRYLDKELYSKEEKALLSKYIWKLLRYPLIQVICMGPGTLFRFCEVFLNQEITTLSTIHLIFTCSQGILYALAYGFTTQVKEVLKEMVLFICCCCRVSEEVQQPQNADTSFKESSNSDLMVPLERNDTI
jgi:hypothetical protein